VTGGTASGGLVRDRYRVARGCLDSAGDVTGLLGALPGARQVEVLGAAGIVEVAHDGRVTPALAAGQAARRGLALLPHPPGRRRRPRTALVAVHNLRPDRDSNAGPTA
jgi:hypothetical protein